MHSVAATTRKSRICVDGVWYVFESVVDDIFVTELLPAIDKPASSPTDDLVVARRRMRHLAPWDIKPLPVMHSVAGPSDESLPPEQRERSRQLGLHLLAVHMWQAAAKTALR